MLFLHYEMLNINLIKYSNNVKHIKAHYVKLTLRSVKNST